MGTLTGKIALVTGASRGIGAAIMKTLGEQGAVVVGTATTEASCLTITEWLKTKGLQGCGMVMDVRERETVQRVIEAIPAQVGASPDILVNNAGVTADNLLMRMKEAEWLKTLETNLSGVFHVTQACLRTMLKNRWGRIISISSVVGAMGNAGQTNYAATKAGLEGFSKSLAREIGSRGVTVNVVAPGFVETDMTQALSEEQRNAILAAIPLGAIGLPEDVAACVAFLASPAARYITGAILHVNGGLYMH